MDVINYRLPEASATRLDERATRSATTPTTQARTDMLTLWDLIDAEARRLPLTVAEASCLASIVGQPMMSPGVGLILLAEASDAFRLAREADPTGGEVSSYAAQYEVDEERLLERLAQLGPAGDLAVRDALSRWWAGGMEPTVAGFVAVGLRVREYG